MARDAAADAEFEAAVRQDVADRRLLGDLDRAVQRQQRHRGAKTDAARPLRRRGQYDQRVGEDRERPDKVDFAEPDGVEAEFVGEIDLRQDVPVALLLGIPVGARQLIEKPKAHAILPAGDWRSG